LLITGCAEAFKVKNREKRITHKFFIKYLSVLNILFNLFYLKRN